MALSPKKIYEISQFRMDYLKPCNQINCYKKNYREPIVSNFCQNPLLAHEEFDKVDPFKLPPDMQIVKKQPRRRRFSNGSLKIYEDIVSRQSQMFQEQEQYNEVMNSSMRIRRYFSQSGQMIENKCSMKKIGQQKENNKTRSPLHKPENKKGKNKKLKLVKGEKTQLPAINIRRFK